MIKSFSSLTIRYIISVQFYVAPASFLQVHFYSVPIKLVKLGRKPKLVENLVQKPIIELRSIKKSYGSNTIINDFNLTINNIKTIEDGKMTKDLAHQAVVKLQFCVY